MIEELGAHASFRHPLPGVNKVVAVYGLVFLLERTTELGKERSRSIVHQVKVLDHMLALFDLLIVLLPVIIDCDELDERLLCKEDCCNDDAGEKNFP